jgi:hypothetical protein
MALDGLTRTYSQYWMTLDPQSRMSLVSDGLSIGWPQSQMPSVSTMPSISGALCVSMPLMPSVSAMPLHSCV